MPLAEVQPSQVEAPAAEPARPRRKVKNYLLDTGLQLKLASYLVAVATVLSVGLGWMLWRAYREASEIIGLQAPDPNLGTALVANDRLKMFGLAGALVLLLGSLLVAAVRVTHRIAGPAYAIRRTCKRVAEGDLSDPPPLRAGDLLLELGDDVADMVKALRSREARERDVMSSAAKVLRDPFASAQTRQELARELEKLASEKDQRQTP